jgi:hypothetical protein
MDQYLLVSALCVWYVCKERKTSDFGVLGMTSLKETRFGLIGEVKGEPFLNRASLDARSITHPCTVLTYICSLEGEQPVSHRKPSCHHLGKISAFDLPYWRRWSDQDLALWPASSKRTYDLKARSLCYMLLTFFLSYCDWFYCTSSLLIFHFSARYLLPSLFTSVVDITFNRRCTIWTLS